MGTLRMASVLTARPESRVVLWVRRSIIAIVCAHMMFFTWSIIRRYWQVMRIDLATSSTVLRPGARISYDVVTSGETHNRILLELVQSSHSEALLDTRAAVNSFSAYDPRVFRYASTVTLTPKILARFAPGPAVLRLTGFGGQKLLHTPDPRVREVRAEIMVP